MAITLYTVNIGVSPNQMTKVTAAAVVTNPFATFPSTTVANGQAACVDSKGNIFVCQSGAGSIAKITPAGVVSTFATGLTSPASIVIDSADNLYVGQQTSPTVKVAKITSAGSVNATWADTGNAQNCYGMCIDSSGNVFVASTGASKIAKITPAGVVTSAWGSTGGFPIYLCADSSGNVYCANETGTKAISKVSAAGVSTTAFATVTNTPNACVCDSSGNIYVANGTSLSKVTPAGAVTQSWGTLGGTGSQSMVIDSTGTIYAAIYNLGVISKITSAGTSTTSWATVGTSPQMIALDPGTTGSSGTITTSLTKASLSLSATEQFKGTINTALSKASIGALAAVETFTGTITTRLTRINQSGAMTISGGPHGTITTALSGINQLAEAPGNRTGTITMAFARLSQQAIATEIITGAITMHLDTGAGIAIVAHTFEQFIGAITTRLGPASFSLNGQEDFIGTINTRLGTLTGQTVANVVNAEVIILGPIQMNLKGFKTPILGAKLGTPGNGKWYSYRYLDS